MIDSSLGYTLPAIMILASYNNNNGKVIKSIDVTSGGVITAATMVITTMACLLYVLINFGPMMPNFARKNTANGSSKTNPVDMVNMVIESTMDASVAELLTKVLTL